MVLLLLASFFAIICAGDQSAAVAVIYARKSITAVATQKSRGNRLSKVCLAGSNGVPATFHTCNMLLTTTSSCRRRNVG